MALGRLALPGYSGGVSEGEAERRVRLRADALKERIYITFTALAVTVAFERDAEHLTVGTAAATLAMTVLGTLLAVFIADVIASMTRDQALPSPSELSSMLYVSLGSMRVIIAPTIILGFSAFGGLALPDALRLIAIVLVATLVIVSLIAVLRLRIAAWQKIVVLAEVAGLWLAVLAIELSVH